MESFLVGLAIALIAVLFSKLLDEIVETIKRKASKSKNSKKP